jgi:iduronate 2-sulfatase
LGLAENTIVVIWGDHGWHLGEHNFWGKHNTLDDAVRVPLIVKVPGKAAGLKSDALVGVYDIFPTLCALAKVPTPETVQGRSFVSLLDNPKQPFREAVYTRYGKGDAVVTDHLIYTSYGDEGGEMLYDLKQDPHENQNLAAKPERKDDLARMQRLLKASQETATQAKVPKPLPRRASDAADPNE